MWMEPFEKVKHDSMEGPWTGTGGKPHGSTGAGGKGREPDLAGD